MSRSNALVSNLLPLLYMLPPIVSSKATGGGVVQKKILLFYWALGSKRLTYC